MDPAFSQKSGVLSAKELNAADILWLRLVQSDDFPDKVASHRIPNTSNILQLDAVLGPNGLLRIGGPPASARRFSGVETFSATPTKASVYRRVNTCHPLSPVA